MTISAQAILITDSNVVKLTQDDVNQSFMLNWTSPAGDPSLSATSTWTVYDFNTTTNTVILQGVLANTTDLSTTGLSNAGITTFGFEAPGLDFADSSVTGDVFSNIDQVKGSFPGGSKVNTCVFTTGCNGGSQNSALAAGDETYITLSLVFGDNIGGANGIQLSAFPIKFQTSSGSYEFTATGSVLGGEVPPGGGNPTNPSVPEPSILWLFGAGLFALSWLNRRHYSYSQVYLA
ncbi:cistern family PEP-CTERM protein [Candidatus Nitrosacidococcus tergens]|nr:cistern family PEP-CTERM protein [Candidatus Nitrosacidococcus tergens]